MATTKFSTIIGSAQVVPVIGVLERVTSYTIGGSTTAPTPGAGATFLRVTEQYGPMAKVRFEYKQTSAGSSGSGIYQFPLSTLITVDTTRLGNGVTSTANNICGHGAIQIGANGFEAYAYYNPTLNIISLQYDPQGVASTSYLTVDNTNGSLGNATLLVSFDVWLPITNSPSVAQGAGLATSLKPGIVYRSPQTAITIASAQAGFTSVRAMAVAYMDNNGVWRMTFNATATWTSATVTFVNVTIAGVTFKNVTNFSQAVAASYRGQVIAPVAYCNPNTSGINIESVSATATVGIVLSGDIELDSKPSWA